MAITAAVKQAMQDATTPIDKINQLPLPPNGKTMEDVKAFSFGGEQ